jgi:hypothetical protein
MLRACHAAAAAGLGVDDAACGVSHAAWVSGTPHPSQTSGDFLRGSHPAPDGAAPCDRGGLDLTAESVLTKFKALQRRPEQKQQPAQWTVMGSADSAAWAKLRVTCWPPAGVAPRYAAGGPEALEAAKQPHGSCWVKHDERRSNQGSRDEAALELIELVLRSFPRQDGWSLMSCGNGGRKRKGSNCRDRRRSGGGHMLMTFHNGWGVWVVVAVWPLPLVPLAVQGRLGAGGRRLGGKRMTARSAPLASPAELPASALRQQQRRRAQRHELRESSLVARAELAAQLHHSTPSSFALLAASDTEDDGTAGSLIALGDADSPRSRSHPTDHVVFAAMVTSLAEGVEVVASRAVFKSTETAVLRGLVPGVQIGPVIGSADIHHGRGTWDETLLLYGPGKVVEQYGRRQHHRRGTLAKASKTWDAAFCSWIPEFEQGTGLRLAAASVVAVACTAVACAIMMRATRRLVRHS